MNKIKEKFEWAKCQENLSRDDMLDQLQDDILTIIDEYNELLLDVLFQSCGEENNKIDNRCTSAYEDACIYLEKAGLINIINSRLYGLKNIGGKNGKEK